MLSNIKNNKAIFIQKPGFTRFDYIGSQWYQKINLFLVFVVFFAINYVAYFLINRSIGYWTNNTVNINSNSKIALITVYAFHTIMAQYYVGKAFSGFYADHHNGKCGLIGFIFYLANAGTFMGLIFGVENFFYNEKFALKDFFLFRYYFGVLTYILVFCALNNLYLIRFSRKVAAAEVNLYKIRLLGAIMLLLYVLVGGTILEGNSFSLYFKTAYFKYVKKLIGEYSFIGILRTIAVLTLLTLPLTIGIVYYCLQNHKYKKLKNPMLSVLITKLSFVVLSSNIVYYITQSKDVYTGPIDVGNYVYIAIAIATVIIVYFGLIGNKIKLNSSAYYFLIVSFGWLVLAGLMIMIFLIRDYNNIYTKLNSVVLSIGSLLIFATIAFNYCQMNKIQTATLNLSTTLIGTFLIAVAFLNNAKVGVVNNKPNVYLFMYLSMGTVIFLNFNVFLFGFIGSIKRLRKESKSKRHRNRLAKYQEQQAKLAEIYND